MQAEQAYCWSRPAIATQIMECQQTEMGNCVIDVEFAHAFKFKEHACWVGFTMLFIRVELIWIRGDA